jgi:hypothetical protein
MGDIIGMRLEAIVTAMNLLGIESYRQLDVLEKVLLFSEGLYKKD